MGWFGGGVPTKVTPVREMTEDEQPRRQQLLEDMPPKFEDKEPVHAKQPTYYNAFQNIQWSDFTIDNFVTMPCFREAMLTGFQAMGVLGAVTFFIHKNPSRSINWGISGFFLGSVVGWEQCRSIRRRSFQTVEAARLANQDKVRKKMEEQASGDDNLEKFQRTQGGK